ncbi:hypothetical protein B0H34DRAFT_661500 [Crassisporium funariophilum]|nr:hypothetical protein B0H34DRAFT_661500 [Crassisporium funariophilum]
MLALWTSLLQTFIQITAWLFVPGSDLSPSLCLRTSLTIEGLVTCLDRFTVPHDYYDDATYTVAQPTIDQRNDWNTVIRSLLSVDGNCSSTPVPNSLQGLYIVESFLDVCVLYETSTKCGTFMKGWGFLIVPGLRSSVSRNVHISAPHPGYDLGSVEQAAALFKSTGSKSLLVAGRVRTAFLDPSGCIAAVSASQDYYKTDPAHNNQEPFFDASLTVHNWQRQYDCPSSSCGFLQIHGKGASTCPLDDIFLSSGLGNSSASKSWYTDDTDRPVKRLQHNLRLSFPSWRVSLPSDSPCVLTATKNVVGRYLNGIDPSRVCSMSASSKMATGQFLHAEQSSLARSQEHYAAWSQAILKTFAVTCAEGMSVNHATGMCHFDEPLGRRSEDMTLEMMSLGSRVEFQAPGRWYLFLSFLNII